MQLLAGPPGGGDILHILIYIVHHGLNIRVKAAVNAVAAVIQQGAGGLIADALQLHQVGDHIVDDHLLIVGVDFLSVSLSGTPDKGGGDILVHRADVGLIVDIALIVHLAQDSLLTLLVLLLVIKGVVQGGLVGDTYNAGAFRQTQFRHILAEIGLGGGLHAPGTLAEVDSVQIPFHDLLLVVGLFQLQRAENL